MENMGKTQHTGMSTWHSHIKPALRYIASNSRIPKYSPKNPNTWTISPEKRTRVSSDPTTSTEKMVLSLSRSQKPVIHSLQVREKHLPEDKQF